MTSASYKQLRVTPSIIHTSSFNYILFVRSVLNFIQDWELSKIGKQDAHRDEMCICVSVYRALWQTYRCLFVILDIMQTKFLVIQVVRTFNLTTCDFCCMSFVLYTGHPWIGKSEEVVYNHFDHGLLVGLSVQEKCFDFPEDLVMLFNLSLE